MHLPRSLTLAEARGAWQLLQADSAALVGNALHIDASALTDFDSAALSLLLQAWRQARAKAMSFEISGAPEELVQLAQLYGVAELLGLRAPG